jgi:endonuclease/exonuclease/phosphatase family metal-dependent hydrolase
MYCWNADLKGLKVFSEILNENSLRCRRFYSCIFTITLLLIVIGKLSASVIRIDGGFEDWKDIKICANDPKGDAKGAFDITKVYVTNQGSILYLRFDTTNLLNLQNGPEAEGTLLTIINLPNKQELVLDMRGRRAFLNDNVKERIPWDRLKYIVGPTYAQNEFEIQVDLVEFNINDGDTISIQFDGSDQLSAPVTFTFSHPSETPKRRSHSRYSGTDVRIVSFNTYYEGLSDSDRQEAMGRLLNSVNGDVYCFQEEWKTEGHGKILKRLMPPENKGRWHIHKVQGNVIASKHPLKTLPSKNDRYAAAYIEMAEKQLFIINVHLKAMGYIDSREDRLRVRQVNDILATIDEIYKGKYNEDDTLDTQPAIVMLGDFNLVGSRTPLDMIIDKKDYGLKDWLIPNLIGESIVTWRGGPRASFSPGKLDYIVFSTRTLIPKNGFLLNSELLNQKELNQLKMEADDSKLSDHLLITVDFQFSDSISQISYCCWGVKKHSLYN